jgi:hypothetical protein
MASRVIFGIAAIGLPLLMNAFLLLKLREHRTDLSPNQGVFDGKSRFSQINVLRASNYTAAGRRLLLWYVGGLLVQALGFIVALTLFFGSQPS